MSKFLNIFAPAAGGAAGVLAIAYVLADQFVVNLPAPVREAAIQPVDAQEAASEPEAVAEAAPMEAPEVAPEIAVAAVWTEAAVQSREGGFGLGRAALPEEIAAWDIDVRPDGQGLPVGSGDVWTGEEVFVENCAMCHGDFGEAVGRWPALAGGFGTLTREDPVKTIGSYWPYLSTVFDYVNRAMPFGNAQSLSPDDVYAITAYLLYVNDLVDEDFTLSNENFLDVRLPNEENFYLDDRATVELPVFSADPCMTDCKAEVEITMRASVLDVTPDTGAGETEATAEEPVVEEPVVEEAVTDEPVAEEPVVEAAVTAVADPALVEEGASVFRKCGACHQVGENATNRVGPELNGILGRTVAAVDGFNYSGVLSDMGAEGQVWTAETLAEFLANPRAFARGTRMSFAGLRSEDEIAAITAYLSTFGD